MFLICGGDVFCVGVGITLFGGVLFRFCVFVVWVFFCFSVLLVFSRVLGVCGVVFFILFLLYFLSGFRAWLFRFFGLYSFVLGDFVGCGGGWCCDFFVLSGLFVCVLVFVAFILDWVLDFWIFFVVENYWNGCWVLFGVFCLFLCWVLRWFCVWLVCSVLGSCLWVLSWLCLVLYRGCVFGRDVCFSAR